MRSNSVRCWETQGRSESLSLSLSLSLSAVVGEEDD